MKKYTLTLSIMMVLFAQVVSAQVFGVNCPTLEEQQAAYNRKLAAGIVVINTSTQQLQCHYSQLATYYQQLHKDNQQKAKDIQQIAKDAQQVAKDKQQMEKDAQLYEWEGILSEKATALNVSTEKFDELKVFLEVIIPRLGDCTPELKKELTRIHTNRSGHMDGTNPGGQDQNINGFDNPHHVID